MWETLEFFIELYWKVNRLLESQGKGVRNLSRHVPGVRGMRVDLCYKDPTDGPTVGLLRTRRET